MGTFDGGSRGNPGVSGAGWTLRDPTGMMVETGSVYVSDSTTNNVAEYKGIIHLLSAAHRHGAPAVVIKGDSKLVLMQVQNKWKCNKDHLKQLCDTAQAFAAHLSCIYEWIPRKQNKEADALANLAMDTRETKTGIDLLGPPPSLTPPPPPPPVF